MKTKKVLSMLVACTTLLGTLAACGSKTESSSSEADGSSTTVSETTAAVKSNLSELGLDENLKFTETRKITVEVYDRSNDGGTAPDDNYYTKYIKDGMLKDHNVEVTFVPVPRWTEVQELNNLLAAGNAPDICVTYDYPTIQTYADMGGVLDIAPYVEDNKDILTNMWELLGDDNIFWQKVPETGELWVIKALLKHNTGVNTFVREDWLKKLNLAEPTTTKEFEAMLKAFKDNASTLLGADAKNIIPFMTTADVGWDTKPLSQSYIPDAITDETLYVDGFQDDRGFTLPGNKDALKTVNSWYNAGYVWKDFALYPIGDKTGSNLQKAGYVGSFMGSWDAPYRDGENGVAAAIKRLSADAAYVAVDPFTNDAGKTKKYLSAPVDRNVFFPGTNKEPVASLLYLDWLSTLENREFLQIGDEGVTHETLADGSVKTMAAVGDKIMNSLYNLDYTIILNGLDLGDKEKNLKSIANGYAGVDAKYIEKAYEYTQKNAVIGKNTSIYGVVTSEQGQGEPLKTKRDNMYAQAVVASTDKFDAIYDSGLKDFLSSGGQAIIDERQKLWDAAKK